MGGTAGDQGWNLAADLLGNIYFSASFNGTAIFGTNTLVSAGNSDICWGKIVTATPPPLDILRAGTNAVIRWSILASEFRVESTPLLGTPTVWTNLPTTPNQTSLWNVVTNSLNTTNQFFRLNWP